MHHVSLAILMSHSIHIITVFIPGNWFQQQPAFTFMYTLCKGTSSTFKFVRALTSRTAGAFIIQISQAKVQSGLISEHFLLYVIAVSCLFFVFTVLVLFIKLIQTNIYEGLTFVPSLFGTHLMVLFSDIFFNTTILTLHCQWVLLFCFVTLLLNRRWVI